MTDRALFHLDNGYYLPAVEFRGRWRAQHLSSNTAFRGFGGPQGMLVIEEIIDRVARRLKLRRKLSANGTFIAARVRPIRPITARRSKTTGCSRFGVS